MMKKFKLDLIFLFTLAIIVVGSFSYDFFVNAETRVDGKKVETFKRITTDAIRGDSTNGLGIDSDRDGTNEVVIDASGNVGIGTSSPEGKLHIFSASAGAVTANSAMDELVIENSDNAGINILTPNNKIGYLGFGDPGDSFIAGIYYNHTSDQLDLFGNNAQKITILSTGNVGIGTNSPSSILDIEKVGTVSTDNILLELTNTGNAAVMRDTGSVIRFNQNYYDAVTPATVDMAEIIAYADGNWTSTASTQDADLALRTVLNGTMTNQVFIKSSGNVGIGTSSPQRTLDVYGNIAAVKDADWTSIKVGEDHDSKYGSVGWRNGASSEERLEVWTKSYDYPILINNLLYVNNDTANNIKFLANNSASLNTNYITEEVTIPVGSGLDPVVTSSSNLAPAGSLIIGCVFRVTDAPGGGATTIDIGITGSGDLDDLIDGASCDILGESGNNLANGDSDHLGIARNISAATLTLTTDADVTDDAMKVRIIIFYRNLTAPTS